MEPQSYTAQDLFDSLVAREDFLLLDVRNDVEFGRFKVEGPYPITMANVPYVEFVEHEPESVAKVPQADRVKIVCAKEGSARFVGEILLSHGFRNVSYLQHGIKAWGNLLAPIRVNDGNGYELYQFRRPGKASCSYAVTSGREMMLFDPAKNIDTYRSFADERGLTITKTFETHRQADYISGSPMLQQTVGAQILVPAPDFDGARFPYTPVVDGELHSFAHGGPKIRVIHTPGHTPGSTCYLIDDLYLISGDTVFIYSIGRPDLGGMVAAWSKMLFSTMREKIMGLSDSIVALPGHYMDWKEANDRLIFAETLGKIKEINADIYSIADQARFFEFIQSNMRQQPEEYAKIREINAGLVQADEEQQDILDLGKNECAASALPPNSRD